MWNGERILPEGYVNFVSTLAPAWAADKRPIYSGFFWLNGTGTFPVSTSAYSMLGVGGQLVLIVPSHDLVVVRMGFDKGRAPCRRECAAGTHPAHGGAAAHAVITVAYRVGELAFRAILPPGNKRSQSCCP